MYDGTYFFKTKHKGKLKEAQLGKINNSEQIFVFIDAPRYDLFAHD